MRCFYTATSNWKLLLITAVGLLTMNGLAGAEASNAEMLYHALAADPSHFSQLPHGLSSPHGVMQTLTEEEKAIGMIGKVVVELKGSWQEQAIGFRIYRDYPTARQAYLEFSIGTEKQLGLKDFFTTSQNNIDQKTKALWTDGKCDSFERPTMPGLGSSRCAAIANDLPVIVTGLITYKLADFEEPAKEFKVQAVVLPKISLFEFLDCGMIRVDELNKTIHVFDHVFPSQQP